MWVKAESEIKPSSSRPILCYCPGWNDLGYQVAQWKNGKFQYDEDPNGFFNEYVKEWSIFFEAD